MALDLALVTTLGTALVGDVGEVVVAVDGVRLWR